MRRILKNRFGNVARLGKNQRYECHWRIRQINGMNARMVFAMIPASPAAGYACHVCTETEKDRINNLIFGQFAGQRFYRAHVNYRFHYKEVNLCIPILTYIATSA